MCASAEDANKSNINGLAEVIPNDNAGEEHDDTNHPSRPRGAKILAHGCCPGLASKSRMHIDV